MVKHIIVWSLKDEYSDSEKTEIKKGIKVGLEGLKGKVPGIIDITVQTEGLDSSSGDLMLDSTFESVEALNGYTVHPAHEEEATTKVRPFVKIRSSFDYQV